MAESAVFRCIWVFASSLLTTKSTCVGHLKSTKKQPQVLGWSLVAELVPYTKLYWYFWKINTEKHKVITKDVRMDFQHDNDPKHIHGGINFLSEMKMPQSPGLNSIGNLRENVNRLIQRYNCSILDNLWEQLEMTCYKIAGAECEKLASFINRGCASVLKNGVFPNRILVFSKSSWQIYLFFSKK